MLKPTRQQRASLLTSRVPGFWRVLRSPLFFVHPFFFLSPCPPQPSPPKAIFFPKTPSSCDLRTPDLEEEGNLQGLGVWKELGGGRLTGKEGNVRRKVSVVRKDITLFGFSLCIEPLQAQA